MGLSSRFSRRGRATGSRSCCMASRSMRSMWRHLVAPLVAKGYRVWAVNQRGYGATSRPAGERALFAGGADRRRRGADRRLRRARRHARSAHDWGGMIAWVVAIRRLRPLERLVVVNIPHPLCFRRALKRAAPEGEIALRGLLPDPASSRSGCCRPGAAISRAPDPHGLRAGRRQFRRR